MNDISEDASLDVNFLQNEKFDFDLPFSPTYADGKVVDEKVTPVDNDDEVFFGPVGFTEQCMSTRLSSLLENSKSNVKPLSPLTGEQYVEIFTEATKLSLHIARHSTENSETSLNQSNASSSKSSLSNSYLKLSNCSSSSGLSQVSAGKLSSNSSGGKPSQSDLIDSDKENIQPRDTDGMNKKNDNERKKEEKEKQKETIGNTQVAKNKRRSIPKPGSRSSRLPKSKNTDKAMSAFSSPIKVHDYQNKTSKKSSLEKKNQSVEKPGRRRSQPIMQSSVPPKTSQGKTRTKKTSSTTLVKRNIFRSVDSLNEPETTDTKSKLPVPNQSKIPGPKPRRRRSSSTSSASSQSSPSSCKSQPTQEEDQSKTRPAKEIPSTKASLTSSIPLGLIRRSKSHENSIDKKPQPVKALPRSVMKYSKSSSNEPASLHLPRPVMRPPSDPTSSDKTPLAATPQAQSSLPVARRRASIKCLSRSSSRMSDGTPRWDVNSMLTDGQTPRKPADRTEMTEPSLVYPKRRSFIPTPGRNVPSPSVTRSARCLPDGLPLLALSPANNLRKEPFQKGSTENENTVDSDCHALKPSVTSAASVDDLLQLDDNANLMSDVMPMQPKAIPEPDLIDLSTL